MSMQGDLLQKLFAAHAEGDTAQRLDGATRRGIGHADAVELDQHRAEGGAPTRRIGG